MIRSLALLAVSLPLAAAAPPPVPRAPVRPHPVRLHGETLQDDYFWLRDRSDPAVLEYLRAENAHADAWMAPTARLQRTLYREMVSRLQETDAKVPYRDRGYWYYSRTAKGKQYPIYCRKRGELSAREEVLLDLNALARGHSFMALGEYEVSDDERLLLHSLDTVGFRQYQLRVLDLGTGRLGPERIEKTVSAAWAADNRTLFYVVEDAAKRPYRLYRHRLGEAVDELVYEEKDPRFELHVSRSRSRKVLFLGSVSQTTSEYRFLDAEDPGGRWRLIAERRPDEEYYPEHRGDSFLIRTNLGGRNFRLVACPTGSPGRPSWKEVLPHRTDVMLEGVLAFKDHTVLVEREGGLPQLTVADADLGRRRRIPMPEAAYLAYPERNAEFDSKALRYGYESMLSPDSVYDYDMESGQSRLLKRTSVPNYDPSRYESARVHAIAPDGTRIPVSLLHRKGLRRDGTGSVYLTGYGAYGSSYDAEFDSTVLSLVDRGWVYAIAHIRGGGELGKSWHDQGRMMSKKTSFTDFIAAAEHLVKEGYGKRVAIQGGSAGGLLMGAVANMRPELFSAVVSHVPFVDAINTMLDESVPLTVTEFEEWGNPKDPRAYAYMRSYSPYDNIRAQAYPPMLVKTSLHDSQVMYWEPAKYVAKLRALKTDSNPLLLKTNMEAGHGGASGRYDALREAAFDYAFVLKASGAAD